jgi:hypothetical protein
MHWEYLIQTIANTPKENGQIEKQLVDLGLGEWEAVAAWQTGGNKVSILFKRSISK